MIIYARVVAKPVNFPSELELRYETLDKESGRPTAVFGSPFGSPDHYSWEDLKRKFSIDDALASECEALLRNGRNALIARAQDWEDDWEPSLGYRRTKDESKPSCSFCRKPYDIVGHMIASSTEPRAYICDECVAFLAHRKTSAPE
jgi:hypothetical protein